MTKEEQEMMRKLEMRIRQLIHQDRQSRQDLETMTQMMEEQEVQMAELRTQLKEQKAKYDNLKMARMLELGDDDTRSARRRLAHLVKEVDKCIEMLKV